MTDRKHDPEKGLLIHGISALNGKTEGRIYSEDSDAGITGDRIITGPMDLFPRP
jgi:hypothetical protein